MQRTSLGVAAAFVGLALVTIAGCGDPLLEAVSQPRSTRHQAGGPGLPEARPSPFQVELRQRDGSDSTLLRVTDQGVRYTSGHDPHQVTVKFGIDETQLDALYATLREHGLDRIDTVPDRAADADGTSIRMLAGSVRSSASRMGHFVPAPGTVEHYDACVQALRNVAPEAVEADDATTLTIEFDPSMGQRNAGIEVDVGDALNGVTPGAVPTIGLTKAQALTVQLRFGPPAQQIELEVDLAVHNRVLVVVDPERGEPTLVPKAD